MAEVLAELAFKCVRCATCWVEGFYGIPRGPSTVTSLDLMETLTVEGVESAPGLLLVQLFSSPPAMCTPRSLLHLPRASQDIRVGHE
jgi:hypothetical protein